MRSYEASPALPLLVAVLLVALPVSAKAPIALVFEPDVVTAQVTPRAKTVWVLVAQEPTGRGTRLIRRYDTVTDEDGDGVVQLRMSSPPAPSSVWVVVDLTSGQHVIVGGGGAHLRTKVLPPAALKRGANGASARLTKRDVLTVFVIARPGVGAWIANVGDGSAADGDTAPDGYATAVLERMRPIGDSPEPPQEFERNDIVTVISPLTLDVYDSRLAN